MKPSALRMIFSNALNVKQDHFALSLDTNSITGRKLLFVFCSHHWDFSCGEIRNSRSIPIQCSRGQVWLKELFSVHCFPTHIGAQIGCSIYTSGVSVFSQQCKNSAHSQLFTCGVPKNGGILILYKLNIWRHTNTTVKCSISTRY